MRKSFPRGSSRDGVVLSDSPKEVGLNLFADPSYFVKKVRCVITNTADSDAYVYVQGGSRNEALFVPASGGQREDVFPIGEDAGYGMVLITVADVAPTNGGVVRVELSPYEYGERRE